MAIEKTADNLLQCKKKRSMIKKEDRMALFVRARGYPCL